MMNLIVRGQVEKRTPYFDGCSDEQWIVTDTGGVRTLDLFADQQRVLVMTEETLRELLDFDPVWCVACGLPVDSEKAIYVGSEDDSEYMCNDCNGDGDNHPTPCGRCDQPADAGDKCEDESS